MPDLIRLPGEELERELRRVLGARGVPGPKAELTARLIAENQRDGVHSHGVNRFPALIRSIEAGEVDPRIEPHQVGGSGALEQWDGAFGLGPWNATVSMARAVELAGLHGVGAVGLRRTNHWLRAGSYALQAVAAGCLGVCWTNTIALMPAWGGHTPRIGNNPLAIGVPGIGDPLVVDLAMSQFSNGRLEVFRRRGEPLPVAGGVDSAGVPTRDPAAILASRRPLPIGYWKGSALAVALDALAAAISGGAPTHALGSGPVERGVSQVFLAFRPGHAWAGAVEGILADLRAAPPDDPAHPVRPPGAGMLARRADSREHGIPVDADLWAQVRAL